jgi:hypothetical protein
VRIEVLYAFEVITVREVLFVVNILNRVKTVHKIGKKVKISTRRVRFFFFTYLLSCMHQPSQHSNTPPHVQAPQAAYVDIGVGCNYFN